MKRQHSPEPNAIDTLTDTGGDAVRRSVSRNSREMGVVITRTNRDRSAVVTATIMLMIATVPTTEQLRQEIEASLRDEFADIERHVAADRESGDA
jgi:hypothetical protein